MFDKGVHWTLNRQMRIHYSCDQEAQVHTMTTKILNPFNSLLGHDYKIFKLIFTIVASCLIIDLFYTFLVLRPTYTSNEKRKMSADDFPEIIICPVPSVNLDAIESNGYGDQERYFFGIDDIKKGTNQIGWAGNNKSQNVSVVFGCESSPISRNVR